MHIIINDQPMEVEGPITLHQLLTQLEQNPSGSALAINQVIIPKSQWESHLLMNKTTFCCFKPSQGLIMLKIADVTFQSRLFTGTGKFATPALMQQAIQASGSQLVTMAMKRVNLRGQDDGILQPLQELGVKLLPNTSGAKMPKKLSSPRVLPVKHLAPIGLN